VTKSSNLLANLAKSPILWGGLASAGFYALVRSGVLGGPLIERYFASHPVEYAATTMFFVGLAVLVLKALDIVGQYSSLGESILGATGGTGELLDDCHALLGRLNRLPARRQGDYLVCRLREAIEHVRRRGSADSLDEQLKYLADLDAGRAHAGFALVRVIIWAVPVLGFLGTVIGITMAIANLAPGAVEDSLPQVITGLSVAFATTTQALLLSIVLMFAQHYVDQKESDLLAVVDQRTAAELEGRFAEIPSGANGQLVAVRRMAETIGERLQRSLETALRESLEAHARQLTAAEQAAAERGRRHWQDVQQTQAGSLRAMASLQSAITGQADVLQRAVEATGSVMRLEDALNRNLAALAGAGNFEQTVISLAAAIHLLNGRLAQGPVDPAAVQLDPNKRTTHAA